MNLLFVGDNAKTLRQLRQVMLKSMYVVDKVDTSEQALNEIDLNPTHPLVFIEVPPEGAVVAFELIKSFRDRNYGGILVLWGDMSPQQKIDCLDAGADAIIATSSTVNMIRAQLEALLRRREHPVKQKLVYKDIQVDLALKQLQVAQEQVELTPVQYRLIVLLMRNIGVVVSRAEILSRVWDHHGDELTSNAIDVHVMQLRKKLSGSLLENPIKTVHGFGYIIGDPS